MIDKSCLYLDFDAFLRSIKQNIDSSFSVLLGAGASISSGIQSANDCIWDWKYSIYQTNSGSQRVALVDPKKSDASKSIIQKWLDNQPKFSQIEAHQEYSFYAQAAYPIEADRIKYFQNLFQGKSPYIGYKLLCLLNKYGVVKSVWSTNFDGLVERAAQQANITPIAINLDCVDRIYRAESVNELLYIALHGDYKFSTIKNTANELDSQHTEFVSAMCRYFVDKNLIVMGYSGRDNSLMDALVQAFSKKGGGRLYWCGMGETITIEVQNLIQRVRAAGRSAYYVDTSGFDNTMLSLVKYCFSEDVAKQREINEILKIVEPEQITPFEIQKSQNKRYLKSNLLPIVLPKELFQFQISYNDTADRWGFLRERIKEREIIAVPYQDKVYAISTVSIINDVFKDCLVSEIERTSISLNEVERNGCFKELFLKAILYGFSQIRNLGINYRHGIIWKKEAFYTELGKTVHEAIECGLSFIPQANYALISITPSLHIESSSPIEKEKKQEYNRRYLDKMRNKEYEEKIQEWCNILFRGNKLVFDIPLQSNNDLKFLISSNRGFAEVYNYGKDIEKSYTPDAYNTKQTIYYGMQIEEPQLEFINSIISRPFYDVNPMRGLSNHKPFDADYYDKFPQDVCLGIVCPTSYSLMFSEFLKRLNTKIPAPKSSDYIHNYIGFNSIYNCRLDIPDINADRWVSIGDNPQNAEELARNICMEAKKLSEQYSGIVVNIFIPTIWSNYRNFKHNGEFFDLHNYIKAFAAQNRFTTQLIEEKTVCNTMMCEISWWLSLALFVKTLRTPWTLADLNPNTAYAGIGYSVKKQAKGRTEIVLGCSHIYNAQGQGLKYKLSKVEHPQFDKKRNPFLSFEEAFKFGMDILNLFQSAMEKLPQRVVIHKRTPFREEEIEGITSALKRAGITEVDLITITQERNIKFIAQVVSFGQLNTNGYPVNRGTCIKLSSRNALLWTHGVVQSIRDKRRYYQGGRCIPSPLKITKYYGNGDLQTIAKEIIGFTKMNWNSFNFYTKLPATIDTSNTLAQVGNLLRNYNGTTYDYRYFI